MNKLHNFGEKQNDFTVKTHHKIINLVITDELILSNSLILLCSLTVKFTSGGKLFDGEIILFMVGIN